MSGRANKPKEFVEAEDYNSGVGLRLTIQPYLTQRSARAKAFFASLLANPDVAKLRAEVLYCASNHSKIKDPGKHHSNFKRWHELRHMSFATSMANKISKDVE